MVGTLYLLWILFGGISAVNYDLTTGQFRAAKVDKIRCKSYKEVVCSSNLCDDVGTSVTLETGQKISCDVSDANNDEDIPRSKPGDVPAVPLDSFNVSCFKKSNVYDDLGLILLWGYQERRLQNDTLTGFYITITRGESSSGYYARIKLEGHSTGYPSDQCIRFCFSCYGSRRNIYRGNVLTIKTRSVPLPLSYFGKIPTVRYKLPNSKKCAKPKTAEQATATVTAIGIVTQPESQTTAYEIIAAAAETRKGDSKVLFVVITFAILLALIAMIGIVFLRQRIASSHKVQKKAKALPRSVLMIASGKDHDNAHKLAKRMKLTGLLITTNWENRNSIAASANDWFRKEVTKADVIIFINAAETVLKTNDNSRQDEELNDEFSPLINYYSNFDVINTKWTIFLESLPENVISITQEGKKYWRAYVFETDFLENSNFYNFFKTPRKVNEATIDLLEPTVE